MKIGVDLGTTRTLVAAVDRGNYPVVAFLDTEGDAHEHFPSVVAASAEGKLLYGFEALAAAEGGAPLLRSFKRAMASPDVSADDLIEVGPVKVRLLDLLTGFLEALMTALKKRSNAPKDKDKSGKSVVETVIAVPAHAHGPQRYLTLEAFRRAGFTVKAMINEPSAAGFEYTHRQGHTVTAKRRRVVVYDLGGGTFDASLVSADGLRHDVLGTTGLNRLGGDDFDEVLLQQALAAAGVTEKQLTPRGRAQLLDQCRDAKERLTPQSKRLPFDIETVDGVRSANVTVDAFYAAAAPLVESTVEAMRPLLRALGDEDDAGGDGLEEIAGIYLVGGGSGLPLVPRILKETFGRRVYRSPHPAASTAIGLAIAADDDAGFTLADRLSRGFGVFREKNAGRVVRFDPIFLPETAMPAAGGRVVVSRRYRAAHNVGWFRFVECARVDEGGEPRGDLVPFAEVLFPFDAALRGKKNLQDVTVVRRGQGPEIEERYTIDDHGLVQVEIADVETGYTETHRIGA